MSAHVAPPPALLQSQDTVITCSSWVDGLPSPAEQNAMYNTVPSIMSPLDEGEECYSGGAESHQDDQVSVHGVSKYLKGHGLFNKRTRLNACRTLLMRCEILQSIIDALLHKPSMQQQSERPLDHYYSNIRYFAIRAEQLAEGLNSRELQTRCEYWAGRGCGGLLDWEAAVGHFERAIKLDVPNDATGSNQSIFVPRGPRGLTRIEKEDVEFLRQSATQRRDDWLCRVDKARNEAQYEAETSGNPLEDVDTNKLRGSWWTPDRDRVVRMARIEFGAKKNPGKATKHVGTHHSGANVLGDDGTTAGIEAAGYPEVARRTFTIEDWQYIKHGDEATRRREENAKQAALKPKHKALANQQRMQSKMTRSSSISSFINTSKDTSPEILPNLRGELEELDFESGGETPSAYALSTAPSPLAASLKNRRKPSLAPINTSAIQKQPRLGEAISGSSSSMNFLAGPIPYDEGIIDVGHGDVSRAPQTSRYVGVPGSRTPKPTT